MWYITNTPTESGFYGNPHSDRVEGDYELSEELLPEYLDSMGIVFLTLDGDRVTGVQRNEEAYAAYKVGHPDPPEPSPSAKREEAYNTEEIIDWDGNKITVTVAAQLFNYYSAEGSEKANALQVLIAEAKAKIREKYPDRESGSNENV